MDSNIEEEKIDRVGPSYLHFEQSEPKTWAWSTPMKEKTKLALQSWKPTSLFSETYFQAIIFETTLNRFIF